MSTKLIWTFSLPPLGQNTSWATDAVSYTSQVPTQSPTTSPATHASIALHEGTEAKHDEGP